MDTRSKRLLFPPAHQKPVRNEVQASNRFQIYKLRQVDWTLITAPGGSRWAGRPDAGNVRVQGPVVSAGQGILRYCQIVQEFLDF